MCVDWLDLDKSWDTFKSNKAIIRQAIIVICKTIRMAITYFTRSVKEDYNLLLLQDFVKWLAL